ncbi:hypothetical protein V501_05004 [Pseudogymnoascus sp. VKM F-4519 (FW-2642)]|nr:hypothetical protein V501_05004 [Pseudogymnoascus sp. VKM F-4519 (FW-2642)]
MSFGYFIGDFIAGANLSYKLFKALSCSRGASQEYQEAVMEISAIHQAFLQMGWAFFGTEELKALKDALHLKLNSISVLLATAQFHERMPSAVSQYQVASPSSPSILPPLPPSDSQFEGQLPTGLDVVKNPRPLTDMPDIDEKDDIEARFAKVEELINQRRTNAPAHSLQAEIQNAVEKHSDEENKGSLEDSKAGYEPYKETILFTRFEKVLKEHLQEGPRDSALLLDLERMLMRMERGKQKPLKFKDAVGRKFSFPFHLARTWKGMEDIIKQAFVDVDVIGPHVVEGHYDLIGPSGEIILPQAWEAIVEPDMAITMHMWPMREPEPPKNSGDDDDDDQSSRSASPTLVDQDGPSPLESKSKKGRHWRIFKRWPNSASKEK